ncbi:MAG: hypothetical protein ABII02_01095 [Candidatus Magasanikbacteria bacterium]
MIPGVLALIMVHTRIERGWGLGLALYGYLGFVIIIEAARLPYDYLSSRLHLHCIPFVARYREWIGPVYGALLENGVFRDHERRIPSTMLPYTVGVVLLYNTFDLWFAGLSMVPLAFGDPAASMGGKSEVGGVLGRLTYNNKSLYGALCFIIFSLAIIGTSHWLTIYTGAYPVEEIAVTPMIIGVAVAALIELVWWSAPKKRTVWWKRLDLLENMMILFAFAFTAQAVGVLLL